MLITEEEFNKRFTYHPPKQNAIDYFDSIRSLGSEFATFVNENCPEGREANLALTKIEEAIMWANASIARD